MITNILLHIWTKPSTSMCMSQLLNYLSFSRQGWDMKKSRYSWPMEEKRGGRVGVDLDADSGSLTTGTIFWIPWLSLQGLRAEPF